MTDFARHQREYLETVRLDILHDLSSRGMNATGLTAASLRVVENQHLRAQLRGADSIPFIETGQQFPNPSNPSFWPAILEWMNAKNIQPKKGGKVLPRTATNLKRAAYGIAVGIVSKGTKYRRGARGVDLQAHLKENAPEMLEGMGRELLTRFTDRF